MVKRGDIVLVAGPGDYGKPRPALLVQNDFDGEPVESRTVCLITSDVLGTRRYRVLVDPRPRNGLRLRSEVQIDKLVTFPAHKIRGPVGSLTDEQMADVDRRLRLHLDLDTPRPA